MDSLRYNGEYIPDVRRKCNQIYSNHNSGTSQPRLNFHNDAVTLIGDLMEVSAALNEASAAPDEPGEMDMFMDQLASTNYPQLEDRPVSDATPSQAMAALDAFGMNFLDSNNNKNNPQVPTVTSTDPFSSPVPSSSPAPPT